MKKVISQDENSNRPDILTLHVKVIPKARRTEFVGWEGEILKIRLNAVPEKGKANEELIRFLARQLKIPKTSISLLKGETARLKILNIENVDIKQLKILFAN